MAAGLAGLGRLRRPSLPRRCCCRSWFVIPAIITSDRGSQFTSSIWATTCQQLWVKHIITTAYHPQSNGMVERVQRQLKEGLKARGVQADWPQRLPWVQLNIRARTTPKTDSNTFTAEMVYRAALSLPAKPPSPNKTTLAAVDRQQEEAPIPKREWPHPPPTEVLVPLATAEMVYVRKGGQPCPLAKPYSSLYRVMSRGPKYFSINIRGQQQMVTVDCLKPHTGTAASTPAAPPRRGPPPVARPPPLTMSPRPLRRTPSPGLPVTSGACPEPERRPPARLDL